MRAQCSLRSVLVWVLPVAALGLAATVTVLPQIAPGPKRAPSPVTRTRPLNQRHDLDVGVHQRVSLRLHL